MSRGRGWAEHMLGGQRGPGRTSGQNRNPRRLTLPRVGHCSPAQWKAALSPGHGGSRPAASLLCLPPLCALPPVGTALPGLQERPRDSTEQLPSSLKRSPGTVKRLQNSILWGEGSGLSLG